MIAVNVLTAGEPSVIKFDSEVCSARTTESFRCFAPSFSACYSFIRPVLCDWLTLLSLIHCKSVNFGGKLIAHLWHTHTVPSGSNPCLTRHNSVCVFVRVCFVFLTRQEVPSKMSFLIHRPGHLPQGLNTHTPPLDGSVCVCVCLAPQGLTAADTAGERCHRHSFWKHHWKDCELKESCFCHIYNVQEWKLNWLD